MAWTYLAESEDSPSHLESGSDPSPIVKSTPIVRESLDIQLVIDEFPTLQSGTTSEHSMGQLGMEWWTSFLEASHARTSALQGVEKAWQESEADWLKRSIAWPKKCSPSSYSLKMSPQSQAEGDFKSLEKLPKWGMIVDGVLYPLRPLERYTVAKGGSYWATPNTMDHMALRSEQALKHQFTHARKGRTKPANLREQVHPQCWPQNLWPTPDSSARGAYKTQEKRKGHHFTIQDAVGSGRLNPVWVEWLMGYAKGWTELEPWAMQWFQAKRKRRSKS